MTTSSADEERGETGVIMRREKERQEESLGEFSEVKRRVRSEEDSQEK